MNKSIFFFLFLLITPLAIFGRTVWSGSQELDWNNNKYTQVSSSDLGTVSAGDLVTLTYTASSSAQVYLNGVDSSWKWQSLGGGSVSEGSGQLQLYITQPMLTNLSNGVAVSGINATLTAIDITENDGADYSNSVWVGNTVIASDWSTWQNVGAFLFANAKVGNYIRFKFKDLQTGAQFGLQYSDNTTWRTMPGVENVSICSLCQQYTIDQTMLDVLQTYGCIVRGCGYTLTAIDIIDPVTLKALTLSVPIEDNSNWVFNTTSPTLKVTVQNDNAEAVTANAVLRIYTDAYASYATVKQSVSVAANSTATVELPFTAEAGFYRLYATVNDEMAHDAFIVGVNPTGIVSAADKQSDFDSFWATAKEQLATVEATDTPVLTEITSKSTDSRKVYLVEFKSVPDGTASTDTAVTVRGYYCEPTDGKAHPVIMHYLGYDSSYSPGNQSATPYCPSGDANPSYAEFYLSTRGQSVNNRASSERDDGIAKNFTNAYGDWFAFNFGNKDSYYYRGAYMDCVRAIDFMATRSTSDMDQLFAEGQSQGGAFTYAAAALSGRTFKAIAPAITFMGDFPDYFKRASWPASVAMTNKGTMTDEEMYAFLSYFDTKNLAALVCCPVITSIGLQDNVCPPHTNIAPYNNVTADAADKQIVYNPELAHAANSEWYATYNAFFKAYETGSASGTKTIDVTTVLYEGTTALNNWHRNYEQSASVINSLQEGDVLTVHVSAQGEKSAYPQLRICWGSSSDKYVSWACYNNDCPYDYVLTLTAEQVEAVKAAGRLYLNGCNITVSKWTLTQHKTVSSERGNAATTIWTGPQTIDWSVSPSTYATVEASAFANATVGMKLRMNFNNMKMNAQGHIVKGGWQNFGDANTFENLPTNWGDYFEYTITTDSMLTELKANGMHVTGVGYTLTSVLLIDPMKEYVINTSFDTGDIRAWEPGDGTPNFTVTLTNYEEQEVTTSVSVLMMTDMFEDYNTYSTDVTLAPGETKTVDLKFSDLKPGFYRMAAKANDNKLCTYHIGYAPTNIGCENDAQPDFWTYWDNAKAQLNSIDPKFEKVTMTEVANGTYRKLYEVSMLSVPDVAGEAPVTIKGYYYEPKEEGAYPALIHFQGTDNGKSTQKVPNDVDSNRRWVEFTLSTRGQKLCRDDKYGYDFYSYEWGDTAKHYYRNAYLDCLRAVQFVKSRSKVDTLNIFAVGGSQGGCFTYVAAALSESFRAISPGITGHADFVHGMKMVSWPSSNFKAAQAKLGWTDEQRDAFNSYYDTKNFVSRITCPVFTNVSLQDPTDPTHTNMAPYNLLTNVPATDKEYLINPFKGHATADNWATLYMEFFNKHMASGNDPTGIETIQNPKFMTTKSESTYNMSGQRVGSSYRGLVIRNGRKYFQK